MLVRLNLVLGRVAVDDLVIGELQLRPRARHAVEHRTEGRGQSLEIRVLVLRVHPPRRLIFPVQPAPASGLERRPREEPWLMQLHAGSAICDDL